MADLKPTSKKTMQNIFAEIGEAASTATGEGGSAGRRQDRGTRAALGRPQGEEHDVPPGTPAAAATESSGEARGEVVQQAT